MTDLYCWVVEGCAVFLLVGVCGLFVPLGCGGVCFCLVFWCSLLFGFRGFVWLKCCSLASLCLLVVWALGGVFVDFTLVLLYVEILI